jgi:hypothetical protein
MINAKKAVPKRVLSFILSMGADPSDSSYVRLIKRIWYLSSAVALPDLTLVSIKRVGVSAVEGS